MTPPNTPAPVDVAAVWVDEKTCRESIYVVRGLWKSAPAEVIGGICGLASEALDLRPRLAACERDLTNARNDWLQAGKERDEARAELAAVRKDFYAVQARLHSHETDHANELATLRGENTRLRAEIGVMESQPPSAADRTALAVAEHGMRGLLIVRDDAADLAAARIAALRAASAGGNAP